MFPLGVRIPAGWDAGGGTNAASFNVDDFLETVRRLKKERQETDSGLVKALVEHIAKSGQTLSYWADTLMVPFEELVEVLDGTRPVSNRFWEQVRRVFDPDRKPFWVP